MGSSHTTSWTKESRHRRLPEPTSGKSGAFALFRFADAGAAIDNAIIKPSKPLRVQTVVRPNGQNGQKNDL
jgi:hypothetical protein